MGTGRACVLALGVVLARAPAAAAHDFWVEPSTYRPAPGRPLAVTLRVGDRGVGESYPRNPDLIERFVLSGRDREQPIPGLVGGDPAGLVAIPAPGLWWIGYRSRRSLAVLDPLKFEGYLRDEGLEDVIDERIVRGERDRPGIEHYSRCAKALLAAGDDPADAATVTRPLGLTLELVPDRNPYDLGPGDALGVRLLFEGRPLEGALVDAGSRADPSRVIARRTDADGRAVFPLADAGPWLLAAVHMARTAGPERADWESWWASLTFEVGPPPAAGETP